jgi:PAS domain S-box-containing protein
MLPCPREWLCQQLVQAAQDAIIVADCEGVIGLWNQGAEAMFGYSAEEAMGQPLDLIIPERLRQRHWAGYQRVMATGATRYARELLAVPAVRKDRSRISLEFTITLLHGGDGKLLGAAAIIRDVTVRWQRETARRARLAADEQPDRKALGRRAAPA